MPLPLSGAISFNDINVELGVAGTTTASLNQASYRTLAGVPSGAISMSDFYGKANQFAFTISSNQTNANLRTLAVNAGWNQSSKVVATINSGIYISSNSTGTPALTVNGSFPGGVELVNNGLIIGMGGAGGAGRGVSGTSGTGGSAGSGGGLALSVSSAISINNAGTIGGGGGGGGGGRAGFVVSGKDTISLAGGGGGGGRSSAAANSAAGAGGSASGGTINGSGSAGGAGTVSGPGGGGAGGVSGNARAAPGGSGGGWGASGNSGSASTNLLNSVGGPFGGGGGGGAVSGNGNITWLAFGTRLGGIS
jgi:hypothetical protein